ncbi:hypothetical protein MTES_1838 [Microbacterium testaceum StLB037]|uniref:Uncharacterized protein n=1 Tax=Microbacterium testaceum (strain StLB037) TaxID=979556 RepID=E8NBW9_MICTS|nr:DUF6507 family protein [Microbacterium testaceum]BAJ74802.1 hypothetical protein MTES_1838 [Microbacterium testaceum StLB037]
MTGWRVSPDGVQQVLTGVDTAATSLVTALTGLSDQLSAAVAGTQSAEVAEAMQAFVEAQTADLTLIQQRIPSARQAVIDATNAVTAGDIEMAATTQALAASAWAPDADAFAHHGGSVPY